MGTNYYILAQPCKTCGHKPRGIHLGKSSHGWQFTFQYNGGQFYKSVKEMKAWLKDKKIEDEYDCAVSHKDFWKMIKEKQKTKFQEGSHDLLIDGYSFMDCHFS